MINQFICKKARQDEQSFNNAQYYLSYSILSFVKIKCMFMVRKIGQSLLNAHGGMEGGGMEKKVRANGKKVKLRPT